MDSSKNFQSLPITDNKQAQIIQIPYIHEVSESEEDDLNIGQIWNFIQRRAILISGVTIAVTGIISLWTLTNTPEYEGKFQLQVEPVTTQDRLAGLSGFAQSLTATVGLEESSLDYETQIEILTSPNLMNSIIQDIHPTYQDIDYKFLFGDQSQDQKLFVERFKKTKILEITYQDANPDKVKFVLEKIAQGYLKYSLEDRKSSIRQGIQFIEDQLPQMRQRVDTLQEQLQLFLQKFNLIEPSSQGQLIAERISEIQQQQLEAEAKLVETEAYYNTLKNQLGLTPDDALAVAALSSSGRYKGYLNQLQEIERQIAIESVRFRENSPPIQALREKQQNLVPLVNQEAQRVLGSLLSKITVDPRPLAYDDATRLQIISEYVSITNQLEVFKRRIQALSLAREFLSQELNKMPVILRQYSDLQRELKLASETLNSLLARREALRVDAAQQEVPWELISNPEIPQDQNGNLKTAWPNWPKRLALGTLLGLLLGGATAWLVEQRNNVFHTSDEVKDMLGLPLLGAVPVSEIADHRSHSVGEISDRLPTDRSNSSFIAAFRSLNANIRFLKPGASVRSLVISSATQGDGKSTIAMHLAQAAAAMGQRVLLVDADLHWPQLGKRLGLSDNGTGLSNILAAETDWHQAIATIPYSNNLFVLPAGIVPADPTGLLASMKMQQLMRQWHDSYDLVIYDSPPLLAAVDAKLIAAYTDGLIFVLGIEQTDRTAVAQALEELKMSGTPILGTVTNGVKASQTAFYDQHRRYYRSPDDQSLDRDTLLANDPRR